MYTESEAAPKIMPEFNEQRQKPSLPSPFHCRALILQLISAAPTTVVTISAVVLRQLSW